MTTQDKLNNAAQSHGWANWSEVLLHNAPAHVINLIVEDAMRTQPESKPALEWRPGARVRITGNSNRHGFSVDQEVMVESFEDWVSAWRCNNGSLVQYIAESDAVVVA